MIHKILHAENSWHWAEAAALMRGGTPGLRAESALTEKVFQSGNSLGTSRFVTDVEVM